MSRQPWWTCAHKHIGLPGCPTCDGQIGDVARRALREAREQIESLQADKRRIMSMAEGMSSVYRVGQQGSSTIAAMRERAAIVAYLRAYCAELWWERPAAAVRRAADAIERGEHLEAP